MDNKKKNTIEPGSQRVRVSKDVFMFSIGSHYKLSIFLTLFEIVYSHLSLDVFVCL